MKIIATEIKVDGFVAKVMRHIKSATLVKAVVLIVYNMILLTVDLVLLKSDG